jgi:hypothetical protein
MTEAQRIDDEQAQFEMHMYGLGYSPLAVLKDADGIYKLMSVQQQWRAWQASAEQSRAECEALRLKAARWIPVAEQMPPVQERVLAFDADHNIVEIDMWFGPDFNFGYSHWMPLPANPGAMGKEKA